MVMMTAVVIVTTRAADAHRLEVERGDAGGDVEAGLALHAERLQRVGILRTTDQEVAAAADADGRIGADAAIAAGEFAAAEPRVRRIDGPGKLGLRGHAEIEADAADGGDVRLGPAAFALEHAFKLGDRADDEADILSALALQDAGANRRHRVGAGDRRQQRERSEGECRKSHLSVSAS